MTSSNSTSSNVPVGPIDELDEGGEHPCPLPLRPPPSPSDDTPPPLSPFMHPPGSSSGGGGDDAAGGGRLLGLRGRSCGNISLSGGSSHRNLSKGAGDKGASGSDSIVLPKRSVSARDVLTSSSPKPAAVIGPLGHGHSHLNHGHTLHHSHSHGLGTTTSSNTSPGSLVNIMPLAHSDRRRAMSLNSQSESHLGGGSHERLAGLMAPPTVGGSCRSLASPPKGAAAAVGAVGVGMDSPPFLPRLPAATATSAAAASARAAADHAVEQERTRAKERERAELLMNADQLRLALKRERAHSSRLAAELASLKSAAVSSQAEAEAVEEGRINTLMRRLDTLHQEKGRILVELEREEEMLTNTLQKKLDEVKREKVLLEAQIEREQAQLRAVQRSSQNA